MLCVPGLMGMQWQSQWRIIKKGVKTNDLCLMKHRYRIYRQKQIRKSLFKKKNKKSPSKPHILSDKLIAQVRSPVTLLILLLACSTRVLLHPRLPSNQHHLEMSIIFNWSHIPAFNSVLAMHTERGGPQAPRVLLTGTTLGIYSVSDPTRMEVPDLQKH